MNNSPFDNKDAHDRYLRKNQALSRAYDMDRKDKVKKQDKEDVAPEEKKCHKCGEVKLCTPKYVMTTGYFEGATSVSKELVWICEECKPAKRMHDAPVLTKQKINAMLRGAKKGRL
jgi:hypothetical protein